MDDDFDMALPLACKGLPQAVGCGTLRPSDANAAYHSGPPFALASGFLISEYQTRSSYKPSTNLLSAVVDTGKLESIWCFTASLDPQRGANASCRAPLGAS